MKSLILQGLLLAALFAGITVGKPGWVQAGKYRQQLQPVAPATSTGAASGHTAVNPTWLAPQTKTTAFVTIDTAPDLTSSAPASAANTKKQDKNKVRKPPRNAEDIIQASSVVVVPSSAAALASVTIDSSPDLTSSASASAANTKKQDKNKVRKPPRNAEDIIQASSVVVVPSSAAALASVTVDSSPDLTSTASASAANTKMANKNKVRKPPRNAEDIIQAYSVGAVPSSAALAAPGMVVSWSGAKESIGADVGDKTGGGKDVATTEGKKEVVAAEGASAVKGKPDKVFVHVEDIPISEASLEVATPEVRKGRDAIDDIVAGLASAGMQLAPATMEGPVQKKKKKKNILGKRARKIDSEEEPSPADAIDALAAASNKAGHPQVVEQEEEDGFVVDIPELKKRPSRSQSPREDQQPVERNRKESPTGTGRSEGSTSSTNLNKKLLNLMSSDKSKNSEGKTKNNESEEEDDDDEDDDSTYDREASGKFGKRKSKGSKIAKRQRELVNRDVRRVIRYLLKAVTVESILNIVASEYKRGKSRKEEDDDESLEEQEEEESEEDTRPRRKKGRGRRDKY